MKNNQNYANSKQTLVFTTEFCETEKREMIRMTTFWSSSIVLDSDSFRRLDLSPLLRKKVHTLIGLLIMYTEQV
jgi:hypothetical protein